MKVSTIVTLCMVGVLVCLTAELVVASSSPTRVSSLETGTAHIPFDFWIGGKRLPAGDYAVSPGAPSVVVVFWNAKIAAGEQAFLIPTGHPVASGDCKLIFVLHDGEHYLRAIWYSDGKAVLTSEFRMPLAAGDKKIEVKLLEQKGDNNNDLVRARQ